MIRSRKAIALATVVVALSSAGCSDDPKPKIAPPESSSPSMSGNHSPTDKALSPREQQAAFIRSYFSTVSASISNGDSAPFLALSSRACESCKVIAANLARAYEDGGSIRGGKWTISSSSYAKNSSLGPVWNVDVLTARERWFDGDGKQIKIVRPSEQHVAVALENSDGGWRVREMRLR